MPSALMDDLDRDLLMELQYRFPLTPTPIEDVSQKLDVDPGEAVSRLKSLARRGILKRIGFYYNYRAQRKIAALVAFSAGERYRVLADIFRKDPDVTHNYLRDHPDYNVWIVIKRATREELFRDVEEAAARVGARWIALFSKKTYKLSVKYDLVEGVSRSGQYWRVVERPPTVEDLGVDPRLPRLVRVLPIKERAYSEIASRLGMDEEEVVSLAKELLSKGVLLDPGAAIDGHRAGFTENAMIVMEPDGDPEETCRRAAELPYSTHVVLRDPYPPGSWRHICYFMAHAVDREKIQRIVDEAWRKCRPRDLIPIYSIEDLKPGTIR